ncbi:MAG TPA: hypothetical protein VFG95_09270 [Nitrospiria bacterium]|nr:hypothetical protein [Nitrospiria bacterium]
MFCIPAARGTETPGQDRPLTVKPLPDARELERSLDETLNALAKSMETLSILIEHSQEKFERCRSGESTEEWCTKLRETLKRLQRLENSMGGRPEEDLP